MTAEQIWKHPLNTPNNAKKPIRRGDRSPSTNREANSFPYRKTLEHGNWAVVVQTLRLPDKIKVRESETLSPAPETGALPGKDHFTERAWPHVAKK
jgi:hypothetical protein